jgi:multiple sugar transport system substrate-binding protein
LFASGFPPAIDFRVPARKPWAASVAAKFKEGHLKNKVRALVVMLSMAAVAAMAEGTKEGSWWNEKAPLITAEFEKAYPRYRLKPDLLPINGYVDNAAAAILAGSPPDIIDLDFTQIATFVGKNLLTDITDDVGAKLKASDFVKIPWDYSFFKGRMYGMPNRASASVYFYNKKMYDDVGEAYPKEGWTYDDLLAKARKITVPGQKYGVGIAADLSDPNNVWTSFGPVLWAFGGDFMNADATKTTMDTPQAIRAITFWTELYTKYKVVPEGSVNYTVSRDVVPLFSANKVAMLPFGVNGIDAFNKVAGLQWDLVQAPSGFNRTGGWSYVIPVSAKHRKEAVDYLLWFAKPDVQARLDAVEPSVIGAWALAAPWNQPRHQEILKAALKGRLTPKTAKWGEASPLIIKELQKVLLGQKTPEQAARDMTSLVDSILK